MRVGSLVFCTDQGLGYLAKSFYDHGIVTDVLMVAHGRRPHHVEWYPGAKMVHSCLNTSNKTITDFVEQMDAMLFFETPFAWDLIPYCRDRGIPTILMPMHECMPSVLPHHPDVFFNPSLLDHREFCANGFYNLDNEPFKETFGKYGSRSVYTPVPVDVKWRQRERAEVFVHNAGNGGLRGRNGTEELIAALRHVKSDAKFIIRSQVPLGIIPDPSGRVNVLEGTFANEFLWEQGDVFIFPEKFNGLSLPLQEARAAGMLVVATDRFPMNEWLPNSVPRFLDKTEYPDGSSFGVLDPQSHSPLIPVTRYENSKVSPRCAEFEEAVIDPRIIAAKIDEWYGQDISEYSRQGKEWAETMSWEVLGPKYKTFLEGLL